MTIEQIKAIEQQLAREIWEESYYHFFRRAFQELEPETEFIDNWHIKYLCDEIQNAIHKIGQKKETPENIVCNIPPGSLKSLLFSVVLMAWAWLHYPHLRFAVASYSEFLSLSLSVKSRNLINSDWYQKNWVQSDYFLRKFNKVFSLAEDQNTKTIFTNSFGGFRVATTVGGSITGSHVDVFIGDDLLNPKQADSEALRETANNFWFKTVPSRARNKKFFLKILVMQRLHEEDTAGIIKNKNLKYKWIVIPAELSNNLTEEQKLQEVQPAELRQYYVDGLFFKERFSFEVLREIEKELSTLVYVGQYLQRPSPAKGNIIKPEYFNFFRANDENGALLKLPRYFYSDTAYGKQGSDNSATICYSVYNGNLYIWSVWKGNYTFPEFIEGYKDFLVQMNYTEESVCIFEPKATGISTVQQLKKEMLKTGGKLLRLNVVEDKAPTDNKITRIKAQLPYIQSGGVYLLANQPWIKEFLDELAVFPNGKNDDQVDALEGAIRNKDLFGIKINLSFC